MNDKTRTFAKLLNIHDALYNAIESLGSIKTTEGPLRDQLAEVLTILDTAESQMTSVVEMPWWKKEGD